jgi:hypothetical protein
MQGHNIYELRKKKHGTIDGMRRCENETHLAGRVTEWAKATNLMIAWASAGAHGPFPAPLRPVGRAAMTPKKVILAHAELSFGPSVPATHAHSLARHPLSV